MSLEPEDTPHLKGEMVEFYLEYQGRVVSVKAGAKGNEWSTALGIAGS